MKLKDKFNKKKITVEEIERIYKINSYSDLFTLISKLIENNEIEAIKNSGGNGKKPALYKRYRIIEDEDDSSFYLDELDYKILSKFDVTYYKKNINKNINNNLIKEEDVKDIAEMFDLDLSSKEDK